MRSTTPTKRFFEHFQPFSFHFTTRLKKLEQNSGKTWTPKQPLLHLSCCCVGSSVPDDEGMGAVFFFRIIC